jgi:hypothetical protein
MEKTGLKWLWQTTKTSGAGSGKTGAEKKNVHN